MFHDMSFMGFWWIWVILVPLFVIALVYVINFNQKGGSQNFKSDTAIEILKKRYARGEIDKNEFEERKKVLLN